MVKLSDRLKRLADEVQQGDRIADIGTDHGLLPIFLYENHIAEKVILCDINAGPLEKARENILIHGASGMTDLRRGDGLSPLEPGEVDTIVIAGMGGMLIAEILDCQREVAMSCARLVLQPRNAPDKLRKWLVTNDYRIVKESLVREGKYICEIITAVPALEEMCTFPGKLNRSLNFEVSDLLFTSKDELLIEFIEKKIRVEKSIICKIETGSGTVEHERIQLAQNRLSGLNELLERAREII